MSRVKKNYKRLTGVDMQNQKICIKNNLIVSRKFSLEIFSRTPKKVEKH